ncbi:uncharacterized protein K489DRAFT_151201 [Dissoconium aciculare CBS 342.82]|uniref:Uncharacterized protein n=1 Tax=Dissoconium aciculare CBS 342.82 TaxID=1314786 RepID=A0A6J3MC57_9PEZI|nr:uncharacterized protein K489DRAFT_151201 [Dissoconium aciculare CBS 342.82]KAF1825199.1 hypothetical protein K489DRAFT_151201 [Dissoconium aciculare CBS 342.82]
MPADLSFSISQLINRLSTKQHTIKTSFITIPPRRSSNHSYETYEIDAAFPSHSRTLTTCNPAATATNLTIRRHDSTMSLDQAYSLAHIAQCRLNRESSRPNRNLRVMVGHLSHYQSLRLHILDIESSSSSDFSKPELSRTLSSSSLSHGQPSSHLEEVLEYDDDIPYDDEADDDSLSLSRCASNFTVPAAHPPQQQPQRLPDLESDDSDESDHDDEYDEYDGPVSPEDERCPSEAVVVPQISELAISGLYHHRDVERR